MALDVAQGLHFLHCRRVLHLDLKSANMLLDRSLRAKIGDVGLSQVLQRTYIQSQHVAGTFAWAAPEVLLGERVGPPADVFSLGVLLHEICTGEEPKRGAMRPLAVPQDCPQGVADLIRDCTQVQAAARPTSEQVIERLRRLVNEQLQGRRRAMSLTNSGATGRVTSSNAIATTTAITTSGMTSANTTSTGVPPAASCQAAAQPLGEQQGQGQQQGEAPILNVLLPSPWLAQQQEWQGEEEEQRQQHGEAPILNVLPPSPWLVQQQECQGEEASAAGEGANTEHAASVSLAHTAATVAGRGEAAAARGGAAGAGTGANAESAPPIAVAESRPG